MHLEFCLKPRKLLNSYCGKASVQRVWHSVVVGATVTGLSSHIFLILVAWPWGANYLSMPLILHL